ncbi:MAG: sigma 54-interacting transcriptional regulator [Thermoanaerobaculia bacterium]|nr:sigma 54-interacting transcriptional regulator [Thermoanaerobaculia bacterium]
MAFRVLARFDDQTFRANLKEGRNVLGSDPSCDICLPNATVSRRHAAVTVEGEQTQLEDLGSTNGTLLRSQRIRQVDLTPGEIFVVGRVVVLLEEVPDDDLEVGIDMGDESNPRPIGEAPSGPGFREHTESFSPVDHFTLDHLPKVLSHLRRSPERQQVAQKIGHALYETMPVTAVEIIESGRSAVDGDGEASAEIDRGVLYSAQGEQESQGDKAWVEAASSRCQVRTCFYKKSAADHYRPVVESALLLLSLADQVRGGESPRTVLSATPAERPLPPTVEPVVEEIYAQAERVARGDVGVMIYGESGTGKEVLARFLHGASPRAGQHLVAINCASLPRDLLEAELFGVEKGVATGVEARPGKFESADQGTLFLDEIGDMAPETQAKILRVLQEKEVFRLGGHTPHPARARIIAATNRPIQKMIADGTFRSDLYHRIATWEVELPPLRNRRGDIPNLAAYFLTQEADRYGIRVRGISRAALRALRRYRWPGNIRQLKNEIARAVLFLENDELLDTGRLSVAIRDEETLHAAGSLQEVLEAVERDEIISTLDATGGDTSLAAQQLQISRPTLYRRIKSLEITIPGSKSATKKTDSKKTATAEKETAGSK